MVSERESYPERGRKRGQWGARRPRLEEVEMALLYESWEADGPNGQARIEWVRSDSPGHCPEGLARWIEGQKRNPRCVLITKGRTDRQSHWEKVLWTRPGYEDPIR